MFGFLAAWHADLNLSPADITASVVFVLKVPNNIVGFYSLARQSTVGKLVNLFIVPDAIGYGYGKLLWQYAVQTVQELGRVSS